MTADDVFANSQAYKPWQIRTELREFIKIMHELRPMYALEIGTMNGGTLYAITKCAALNATIISIDLPGGGFGGGYSDDMIPLFQSFAGEGQTLHLIRGNSHHTLDEVKAILGGRKLYLLFIDGDHTYEGVSEDYELYAPLVRTGGIIVFHDIVPHPIPSCGVHRLWDEVKGGYTYSEHIRERGQSWGGIGVLYV